MTAMIEHAESALRYQISGVSDVSVDPDIGAFTDQFIERHADVLRHGPNLIGTLMISDGQLTDPYFPSVNSPMQAPRTVSVGLEYDRRQWEDGPAGWEVRVDQNFYGVYYDSYTADWSITYSRDIQTKRVAERFTTAEEYQWLTSFIQRFVAHPLVISETDRVREEKQALAPDILRLEAKLARGIGAMSTSELIHLRTCREVALMPLPWTPYRLQAK